MCLEYNSEKRKEKKETPLNSLFRHEFISNRGILFPTFQISFSFSMHYIKMILFVVITVHQVVLAIIPLLLAAHVYIVVNK